MRKLLFAICAPIALLLASCGTSVVEIAASGKPYEIFVVAPKPIWDGAPGDTLRSVMGEEVLWVNQSEPLFDLFNITPQAINDNIRRHRNLIVLKVDPKLDSVIFEVKENLWVNGQVVIDVTAPNNEVLAAYLAGHGDVIVGYMSIVEQNRMKTRTAKYNEKRLGEMIKSKFGFQMNIPMGYRLALDTTNFLWMTYDMPIAAQGIVVYEFAKPKAGEKLDVLAARDLAVCRVPGPTDGSYMATDTTFMPESTVVKFNNRQWIETRGFWFVKGDFMGGPFLNYLTFDEENHRYIGVDMYVNSPSPKYPKRNFIRQLESVMLGISINPNKALSTTTTYSRADVVKLCSAAFLAGSESSKGDEASQIAKWLNENL